MKQKQVTRRRFLCYSGLTALGLGLQPIGRSLNLRSQPQKQSLFYVGTYTSGRSEGIYLCRLSLTTGEITLQDVFKGISNPSFLALDQGQRHLYAVNEVDDFEGKKSGAVSSFKIDSATSRLDFLNKRPTRGGSPCHLVVDHTNRNVLVANYGGGSAAVIKTRDGDLQEPVALIQHSGSSVDRDRQQGPHAHCVVLDSTNRFAFVSDLGLDQIKIYRFDARRGSLAPHSQPFVPLTPGSGPRHFVIHPNQRWAYVINELNSTVTAFKYDSSRGHLREFQNIPTLPSNYTGKSDCADIHISPSGNFLYGSNRGHDSLAVFAINEQNGSLYPVQYISTGGKTPRNFAIDPSGTFVLAANQNSDSIVSFWTNPKDGTLTATGQKCELPMPVCIRFLS